MPRPYYERLATSSAAFLASEGPNRFSHSAMLLVFDAGALAGEERGVDYEALREGIEARLPTVPRARQRLRWTPLTDHPVWVDDPDFNLEYHLRHTSLPSPGSEAQLHRTVARIHAQRLDRNRPLWECWVLEGLEGGRFAMLWKTHHCMIDPTSEVDLLQALLSPDPDEELPPVALYKPRSLPTALELGRDELLRGARLPRALTELLGGERPDWRHQLEQRVKGVAKLLGYSMRPRRETPLSGPAGPHRRFTQRVLPLADAQEARRATGALLHDVLLAVLAGAIGRYFREHLVNPATLDFRVSAPVTLDTETPEEDVGEWIVELPIWERDPLERIEHIRSQTRALHEDSPAVAARALVEAAQWTGSRRLTLGARAVSRRRADLVLLNLPGPQTRLYFRGAALLEGFALAPVRADHALCLSVTSYDGKLCWGFNADFDRLTDLERFADAVVESFGELVSCATDDGPAVQRA